MVVSPLNPTGHERKATLTEHNLSVSQNDEEDLKRILKFKAIFPKPCSATTLILAGFFSFVKGFMLFVFPLRIERWAVGVVGNYRNWARNPADWEVNFLDFG